MQTYKQILITAFIAISLVFSGSSTAEELSARQIMDEAADRHEKDFEYVVQEMSLIDKKGNTTSQKLSKEGQGWGF